MSSILHNSTSRPSLMRRLQGYIHAISRLSIDVPYRHFVLDDNTISILQVRLPDRRRWLVVVYAPSANLAIRKISGGYRVEVHMDNLRISGFSKAPVVNPQFSSSIRYSEAIAFDEVAVVTFAEKKLVFIMDWGVFIAWNEGERMPRTPLIRFENLNPQMKKVVTETINKVNDIVRRLM